MVNAYVAVITGSGASADAASAMRELPGVDAAHVVAGEFDVIAEVEAENVRELQKIVTGGIHGIDGVGTTRTYVQMD